MAGGDEMAWRMFYNAYFDRLWRYLLVVAAGNEDTAREALQFELGQRPRKQQCCGKAYSEEPAARLSGWRRYGFLHLHAGLCWLS